MQGGERSSGARGGSKFPRNIGGMTLCATSPKRRMPPINKFRCAEIRAAGLAPKNSHVCRIPCASQHMGHTEPEPAVPYPSSNWSGEGTRARARDMEASPQSEPVTGFGSRVVVVVASSSSSRRRGNTRSSAGAEQLFCGPFCPGSLPWQGLPWRYAGNP